MMIFVTFFLLPFPGTARSAGPASPEELAAGYLQAVLSENWAAVEALWLSEDVDASGRLGITYRGQPFKLDSASLVVLERAGIQSGEIAVSVGAVIDEGSFTRIRFRLQAGKETATADYYAVCTDNTWRFVSSTTALASTWERRETEFLRLRIQPTKRISEDAIHLLDGFIGETCERLGVSADRLELLRAEKFDYTLCDEAAVAEIVGAPTRGAALLQTDAVVTSEPCHLHELAHLLVNFALQELPLYTLPFLQEGTAVILGGRWGRTSEVMQGLGKYSLQCGMIKAEELLSWQDFESQSADWTYAPSGVLVGFLLDTLGSQCFLQLYGQLSGSFSDLRRLDQKTIQERIRIATGTDWETLQGELADHLDSLSCGGILPADDWSGEPAVRMQEEGLAVTIVRDGRWLCWEVGARVQPPACAVLFHDTNPGADLAGASMAASRIFAEQFPDRVYGGELMAAVFTPGEIGFYDFRTDLLVAKYVESFCPEQSLITDGGNGLRFRIRGDLLPNGPWNPELVSRGR